MPKPEFSPEEIAEIDRLAEQNRGEYGGDLAYARRVAEITVRTRRADAKEMSKNPAEALEREHPELR